MNDSWLSKEDVLNLKVTTHNGLSSEEAAQRLNRYGPNKLAAAKKKSLGQRIWEQIRDPMIIVLIIAAVVSGLFGEVADMAIILIVVILNAILGIIQESKAERAIEALQNMAAPHATVQRAGAIQEVAAAELVPGDIVLLEAGDAVPADLRLLESINLKIEESALTGESVPEEKNSEAILSEGQEIPLGDRINMAYMGTNVVYGRGKGVVTTTGMQTEMGKIAGLLAGTDTEKTPLQQKLAALSKVLSFAVLGICVLIFFFGILRGGFAGGHLFETFLTAVSLAVAAIPEGLVVVVTVMLSIGVTKMSHKNAIIRRLTAVETLGCTEVVCSDKTGTLTQNKMTVVEYYGAESLLAEAMAHCNDSQPNAEGGWQGDPTETALMDYAAKHHIRPTYPRVAEVPFDSGRKMMSTLNVLPEGGFRQFTKGAPDEVLTCCTHVNLEGVIKPLNDTLREQILAENHLMAGRALRVLAAAYQDYPEQPTDFSAANAEVDLIFIGLTGMIDPIRPEAKAAIGKCRNAGIRVVMITGDHKDTAVAIAHDLGILEEKSEAITGAKLAQLSDDEFEARIPNIVVYARVQPEHKVRIVNTWKKLGKITAMTGDGVNDAPALKSADIGVGMGITGTDVTKNVADMVLADDNFATIVYAVEEGRRIYENIRKAIQFLLSSNLSEVVAIFLATLAGLTLFKPIHILWINLITDTFPAMALGMEQAEADIMQRPPRNAKESIFAGGLGFDVIWQGAAIALLTLTSFSIGRQTDQITGMSMAFLTLSLCEVFHAINMRSRSKSLFQMSGHNKYLLAAMLSSFTLTMGVLYIPTLNTLFQLTPLPLSRLAIALGLAFVIIPLVELAKVFKRAHHKHKMPTPPTG